MLKARRARDDLEEARALQDQYDTLSREQLVALLRRYDGKKKLGLVWERNEIEADRAIDSGFVAARIDPALSDKAAPWPNLIIEGDNHDALRWLRMTHARKVKCIYIDPPYNTGAKDWVYNDHYVDKTDRYRQSTWLEFLYQRLTLARELLADDGVLLISINDEQRAKLEMLGDETLPGMRIGSLTWRTRQGSNADQQAFLSSDHEHVLVFAQKNFRFGGVEKSYEMYGNPDGDPKGEWRSSDLTLGFSYKERPNLYYPLHDAEADIWYPANPSRVWVYASRNRLKPGQRVQARPMEEWVERGQIRFPDHQRVELWQTRAQLDLAIAAGDVPSSGRTPMLRSDLPDLDFWVGKRVGFGTPAFKRYKADLRNTTQPLSSWITPRAEVDTATPGSNAIVSGTNEEGAKAIKEIFGEKSFNYAKPVSLIRELIRQSTGPDDLVLDFFAGSGTTAQSVMELNAEDTGSRRFIMVSSTEATADAPERNVCRDVTAGRVQRLNAVSDGRYADLAAPFGYLTMRQVAFEDLDYDLVPEEVWSALEALHGLPLTLYDPALGWQEHERDGATVIFAERCGAALGERLGQIVVTRRPLTVYAWAPGQVTAVAPNVEVHPVRQTLTKHFGR